MLFFEAAMVIMITLILFVTLSVRLFVLLGIGQSPESHAPGCKSTVSDFPGTGVFSVPVK